MAEHNMKLDDTRHRSIVLDNELSSDKRYSVKIVLKKTSSGDDNVAHLVIKSTDATADAKNLEIEVDRGFKIPPEVG